MGQRRPAARVHEDRVIAEGVPDDRLEGRAVALERRERAEQPGALEELTSPASSRTRTSTSPSTAELSSRRMAIPARFYG